VQVRHELRAVDDGYRSPLVPGLRASQDAGRLAEEVAFGIGRLAALASNPPDLLGEARERARAGDLEQATWTCFLIVYLCPLQDHDPFAGIRLALEADWRHGELPDLDSVPLGPRASHDPARGDATLRAYLLWTEQAARSEVDRSKIGQQERAFSGEPAWTAERRFGRLFERLTLPGLARMGRYELLVILGHLGLYELRADSLHLTGPTAATPDDIATLAAKRVFGIGDPMHLERRARALAEAVSAPIEALDLALANWGAGERATLGLPSDVSDRDTLERVSETLGLGSVGGGGMGSNPDGV
jgi:hypothetical protein